MKEGVAFEKPLAGVFTEDDSIDRVQIRIAADRELAIIDLSFREPLFGGLEPVLWIWVGGEPFRQPAALGELTDSFQHSKQILHHPDVVSGLQRVSESQLVGLVFVFAAVLEKEHAQAGTRQLTVFLKRRAENGTNAQAQLSHLLLAHLIDGVSRR